VSSPPSGNIGRYRIERRLGSGGMGVVYLCRADETGTAAAVKLIRAEYAANPQLRERLRREVTAARRVPRFCTAPVLDADVDADPPWIATEYVDGPTLDAAVLEHGPLTGTALESFAVGVAVALRAIHQHGVIHRDLKPSNILLSPLGPRVIDFGVARLEDAHTQLTHAGAMIGTPAYMTPEQLRGEPATAAVDVFAWASLVTYAATGRPPFGSGRVPLRSIIHEPPDLGDLSGPLRELVIAAFAKDPAARPSTAELVDQLSSMAPATTTQVLETATTPPPSRPPSKPRTARRRMVAAAAATAAVVAIAAGVVTLVRGDGASAQLQDEARSRQFAVQAREAYPVDPQRSMELALDAWAAAATPEARGALLSAYTYPYYGQLGTEPGGISVAVAPDGATVAVGHGDGTVQLWDVATRQPIGEPLAGHTELVFDLAFSPDGTMLATASAEWTDDGVADGVRVWDMTSGELTQALPGLNSVAWLPGGETLVSFVARVNAGGGLELGLEVWDVHTGQVLTTILTDELGLDVAVSRDGAWVAAGYGDGTAEVWRLDDGSTVAELVTAFAPEEEQTPGGVPVTVAFSPDGELATVPNDGAGEIQTWSLPAADEPRSLTEGETRAGGRLTYTSDGFLLATGGGHPIQWWEPRTGWNWGEYRGFQGTPLDVDASADGKLVAAAGTGGLATLWQRATYFLPYPNSVLDLAYNPAGDRFATADADGVIRIWDAASTTIIGTSVHTGQTRSLAMPPTAAWPARPPTAPSASTSRTGSSGRSSRWTKGTRRTTPPSHPTAACWR
jgi:WD40 repeat protein